MYSLLLASILLPQVALSATPVAFTEVTAIYRENKPTQALFKGQRVIHDRTITIASTPDKIFPLICPVREGEWSDGWVGKPVYSKSGVSELNGVFASEHGEVDDTIWFVTKFDKINHEIEFVYFVPGIQVVRLSIDVKPLAASQSSLTVHYIRTSISEKGNQFMSKNNNQHGFDSMMNEWELAMNYFMKTGKILKDSH